MATAYEYRLETDDRLYERLAAAVSGIGNLAAAPPRRLTLTLLDSFDWRLYRAGITLCHECASDGAALLYRETAKPQRLRSIPLPRPPRLVADLPPGPPARKLGKLLAPRALLPRAVLSAARRSFLVLDDQGSTVVRLHLEQLTPRGSRKRLRMLRIEPLQGYEPCARSVAEICAEMLQLPPAATPWELEAYRLAGVEPGDYASKLRVTLSPDLRCDLALHRLLTELTAALRLNEPGMRQAIDPEFLHDYRVAVRRIRSALGQLKGVLAARTRERFRRAFAWLGSITGAARDLDVYLLSFDRYASLLPAATRADLAPLRELLDRRRTRAYDELNRHLDSKRYGALLAAWQRFLETPPPPHSRLPNAARPVKAVADEQIWRVYRKVIKGGRRISDQSPPQALHRLRIRCKRLRYLLEFFRSLYPERRIGKAIDALKDLQEVLGRFQDLEVQQSALRHFAKEIAAERPAQYATLSAIETLITRLRGVQNETRGLFAEQFERFTSRDRRKDFAALFHTDATAFDQRG